MNVGQRVIVTTENGRQFVGIWKGTSTFKNKPTICVQCGKVERQEYLDDVAQIEEITASRVEYKK